MKIIRCSKLKCSILLLLFIYPILNAYAGPIVFTIAAGNGNGTKIGSSIAIELQKKFPNIASQYDHYLAFLLSPSQFKQLVPQVNALISTIDPEYQSEVNAIAAALQLNNQDNLGDGKLSLNEVWLLQFLPDLTSINKGSAIAAANSNPVAARNVDWKNTPDLTELQAITIFQYDDRTVVTIGFAGLMGVINGFNDQGLFVSQLDASTQLVSASVSVGHAGSFDLRSILRQHRKIAPASQELSKHTYPRSHVVLLADPEDVAVLEQPAGVTGKLRKTDSVLVNEMPWYNDEQMAIVNCFVLKALSANCHASQDYFRWARFAELLKDELLPDTAISIMQDRKNKHLAIFNEDTLQSMVFWPKDRTLYLYAQNSDQTTPVVEKYQFFNTSPKDKLVDMALLALGIVIFVLAWLYVFRDDIKGKMKRLTKKIT